MECVGRGGRGVASVQQREKLGLRSAVGAGSSGGVDPIARLLWAPQQTSLRTRRTRVLGSCRRGCGPTPCIQARMQRASGARRHRRHLRRCECLKTLISSRGPDVTQFVTRSAQDLQEPTCAPV